MGRIEEFIESAKGLRTVLCGIVITILLQVGSFIYFWGTMTTTVNRNTDHIWKTLTPTVAENTKNIDRILGKLESVQIIGYVYAKGEQGIQGIQGIPGKDVKK